MERIATVSGVTLGAVFVLTVIAAWVTHLVTTLSLAVSSESWFYLGLLVVGALVAPLGVIHGVMIWFGAGL